MNWIKTSATGAAILLLPLAASAQDSTKAVIGEVVRVIASTIESRPVVARLWASRTDELVLRPRRPQDLPLAFPMSRVDRVEVRRPTGEHRAGAGAIIGTVVGFVVMGAWGYQSSMCGTACGGDSGPGPWGVVLAIPGSGLGAIAGTIIGRLSKVHEWKSLPFPIQLADSVAGFRRVDTDSVTRR